MIEGDSVINKYPRLFEAMFKVENLQKDGRTQFQILSDTQDLISQLLDSNSSNNLIDEIENLMENIETSLKVPEELKRKLISRIVNAIVSKLSKYSTGEEEPHHKKQKLSQESILQSFSEENQNVESCSNSDKVTINDLLKMPKQKNVPKVIYNICKSIFSQNI